MHTTLIRSAVKNRVTKPSSTAARTGKVARGIQSDTKVTARLSTLSTVAKVPSGQMHEAILHPAPPSETYTDNADSKTRSSNATPKNIHKMVTAFVSSTGKNPTRRPTATPSIIPAISAID